MFCVVLYWDCGSKPCVKGAAGACPVGLPIVWLGPQARAQMMMGGRSEQATVQNVYSMVGRSEQATIQNVYSMVGRSEEGATLPRTGTSCQGFHNAGVPTFKPTMATHDSDGDDGNDDENDDEDDDDDDSDDDVSTNLQTHHDCPPAHLPPFKSHS